MKVALILTEARQMDLLRLWTMLSPALPTDAEVELWLCSSDGESAFSLAMPANVKKTVYHPSTPLTLPEHQLLWLEQLATLRHADLYTFYDNIAGHQLAVRLATRLNLPFFTDIHALEQREGTLFALRSACGSHLNWHAPLGEGSAVLSVARGRAIQVDAPANRPALQSIALEKNPPQGWLLHCQALERRSENPLESADTLFIGGRGLGSREACDTLRLLAAKRGGAAGFTRPVAMNGWCGLHEIVGQSGVRTSPRLCVAFGVSGAAAFMLGVQDAHRLIAINTDPNAPIFKHADLGILADAPSLLAAME